MNSGDCVGCGEKFTSALSDSELCYTCGTRRVDLTIDFRQRIFQQLNELDEKRNLIDFLDKLEIPRGHGWQLRRSSTGRGWRLLTTSRMPNHDSASSAIREQLELEDLIELDPPMFYLEEAMPCSEASPLFPVFHGIILKEAMAEGLPGTFKAMPALFLKKRWLRDCLALDDSYRRL